MDRMALSMIGSILLLLLGSVFALSIKPLNVSAASSVAILQNK